MRAAVLNSFEEPLRVETVPVPTLESGQVIVDVVAAPVLSYAGEVYNGARQYPMPLPMTVGTGAVGKVRSVGDDTTHLRVGDWVLCDPVVTTRDHPDESDELLQGLSGISEGGVQLMSAYCGAGSFAEQLQIPTENAVPIKGMQEVDAVKMCALTTYSVPFGGFRAANLQVGSTVLITGATGSFGSAAVAVALAMGAATVIAAGRSVSSLQMLESKFGQRVKTVQLADGADWQPTTKSIKQAAAGIPIDCMLDILPPNAPTDIVKAGIFSVKRHGTIVIMGALGDLHIPYRYLMRNRLTIKGMWMYNRETLPELIGMVRSGLLSLDSFEMSVFKLEQVTEAVAAAAANAGPFKMTVITP